MLKKIMSCVIVIALFAVMAVAVSAASSYNAYDQFDTANAAGANGPWSYMNSVDDGKTFTVNTNYVDQYKCWYPSPNNWFGVGISPDANKTLTKAVEINSASQHQWGALVFTAPEDGKYSIPAFDVTNLWNQDSSNFVVAVNGSVKYKTADGALDKTDGDKGKTASVPAASYDLKKGDQIQFYNVPVNKDQFVSAYACNLTINYGTAAAPADTSAGANPKTGDSGIMMLTLLVVLSLGSLIVLRKTAKN